MKKLLLILFTCFTIIGFSQTNPITDIAIKPITSGFPDTTSTAFLRSGRIWNTGFKYATYINGAKKYFAFKSDLDTKLTGSGSSNQVSYWTGTSSQGGEAAFIYNPSTNKLSVDYISTNNVEVSFGSNNNGEIDASATNAMILSGGTTLSASSVTQTSIIAGTDLVLTDGSGDTYLTGTPPTDNTNTSLITRDNSTGKIEIRTVASLGASPAGSNTEVQINNSGAFGTDSQFKYVSDVLYGGISLEQQDATNVVKTNYNTYSIQATKLAAGPTDFQFNGANGISGNAHGGGISIIAGSGYSSGDNNGGSIAITPGTKNASGVDGKIVLNGGVNNNGSGFKHGRVTTGSIGAGSTALITLTWGTTFSDTNYTCTCSVVDATTSSLSLSVQHIEVINAANVQVRILNNAVGSITGTVHCIAVHD